MKNLYQEKYFEQKKCKYLWGTIWCFNAGTHCTISNHIKFTYFLKNLIPLHNENNQNIILDDLLPIFFLTPGTNKFLLVFICQFIENHQMFLTPTGQSGLSPRSSQVPVTLQTVWWRDLPFCLPVYSSKANMA